MEAELLLSACTEYVRNLYWNTKPFNGGRWLMVSVTSGEVMEDVKNLVDLREGLVTTYALHKCKIHIIP